MEHANGDSRWCWKFLGELCPDARGPRVPRGGERDQARRRALRQRLHRLLPPRRPAAADAIPDPRPHRGTNRHPCAGPNPRSLRGTDRNRHPCPGANPRPHRRRRRQSRPDRRWHGGADPRARSARDDVSR
ncbi:unnamed protein product [Ectocarpus sp. 4 AP-2014]